MENRGLEAGIATHEEIENALRLLAGSISKGVGEEFFRALVRDLATALQVHIAFVSELNPSIERRVRLIALWEGNGFGENFEYDVKGKPCELVFVKGIAYFNSGVQDLFPEDHWLVEKRIESYLAIPLYSPYRKPIGHLGVMDERPMGKGPAVESFLRIFAFRAGAELERRRTELELREKTAQLELTNKNLSALYTITAVAGESLELDVVLQEATKKITDIFQFDATRIFLLKPQSQEFHLEASFQTCPELSPISHVFASRRGIVGRVFETGRHLVIEDVQNDPRYEEWSFTKHTRKAGSSFLAVFPIQTKGKCLGAIVCIGKRLRQILRGEIQLIMSMAAQLGVAVENIQLYVETKNQAVQLQEKTDELCRAEEKYKKLQRDL